MTAFRVPPALPAVPNSNAIALEFSLIPLSPSLASQSECILPLGFHSTFYILLTAFAIVDSNYLFGLPVFFRRPWLPRV